MMKKLDKQITTIIGKDAICQGALTSPGGARVDGTVEGDVKVTGVLVVGSTGVINGNVEAASCVIGGVINGNIVSPEKTELTPTAKVVGDIKTGVIVIDEKAIFQGCCDMKKDEENSTESGKEENKTEAELKAEEEKSEENKSEDAKEDETSSDSAKEEKKDNKPEQKLGKKKRR